MGTAAVLIVLALALGAMGLLLEGLRWLLIIALISVVVSVVLGARTRRTTRATTRTR